MIGGTSPPAPLTPTPPAPSDLAAFRLDWLNCLIHAPDQGRPVAFMLNHQFNGRCFLEETGYDPAFAPFSPGTVLLVRIQEDLIARDTPRLLDFSWGDAEYKQLFSTEGTQSGRVLLVRRAIKPLFVAKWRELIQTMGKVARADLSRSQPLARLVRKWRHC